MLDLGVWAAVQSFVEKLHRGHRTDVSAIANTVERAWGKMDSDCFRKVYLRWQEVIKLILEDNGGNAKVEERRGRLTSPIITDDGEHMLPSIIELASDLDDVPDSSLFQKEL
jgi:hypothetical protein